MTPTVPLHDIVVVASCERATLKNWEWPGDEARIRLSEQAMSLPPYSGKFSREKTFMNSAV